MALAAILRRFGNEVDITLFSLSFIPMLIMTHFGSLEGWCSSFVNKCLMCVILAPGKDSMWTWLFGDVVIRERFESPRMSILLFGLVIFQSAFLCIVFSCLFSFTVKTGGVPARLTGPVVWPLAGWWVGESD